MNEHIENIAKQCEDLGTWPDRPYSFDHEKFARLLLEECVTICEEGSKTQTTSGGVAILIKQRFGL